MAFDSKEKYEGFTIREISTHGNKRYQLDLGTKTGSHIRRSFNTLTKARKCAREKRIEIEKNGILAIKFTDRQKDDAVEAQSLLKEYGINLRAAAAFYIKHNQKIDATTNTEALVDQYLLSQHERMNRKEIRPRTYSECRKHLDKFKTDFSTYAIDSINAKDIDRWLDDKLFKATSRDNHRRYIKSFFNWTIANEKLISNPVVRTRKIKKQYHIPEIYSPQEVEAILNAAQTHHKELVPYLAIAFFAGIRPNEIQRLDWKAIDFEHKEIHIEAAQSKTSSARIVHMQPNLEEWLLEQRKDSGLVFPFSEKSLSRWRRTVLKKAEVKSIQDGARHSFATFHLALNSVDDTMQELGHTTPQMLFRHYRGLAKNRKAQAKEYFSISPSHDDGLKIQESLCIKLAS